MLLGRGKCPKVYIIDFYRKLKKETEAARHTVEPRREAANPSYPSNPTMTLIFPTPPLPPIDKMTLFLESTAALESAALPIPKLFIFHTPMSLLDDHPEDPNLTNRVPRFQRN
jgi:hypothetical protein